MECRSFVWNYEFCSSLFLEDRDYVYKYVDIIAILTKQTGLRCGMSLELGNSVALSMDLLMTEAALSN